MKITMISNENDKVFSFELEKMLRDGWEIKAIAISDSTNKALLMKEDDLNEINEG